MKGQNAVDRVTCEIPHPTDLTFFFSPCLAVTRWCHGGALHEERIISSVYPAWNGYYCIQGSRYKGEWCVHVDGWLVWGACTLRSILAGTLSQWLSGSELLAGSILLLRRRERGSGGKFWSKVRTGSLEGAFSFAAIELSEHHLRQDLTVIGSCVTEKANRWRESRDHSACELRRRCQ